MQTDILVIYHYLWVWLFAFAANDRNLQNAYYSRLVNNNYESKEFLHSIIIFILP